MRLGSQPRPPGASGERVRGHVHGGGDSMHRGEDDRFRPRKRAGGRVHQHVRALQHTANAAARAPPEILSIIFKMLVQNPFSARSPTIGNLSSGLQREWMNVRLVRQTWRNTADTCTDLWTNIVVAPLEGHDEQGLATLRSFFSNSLPRKVDACLDLS